MTKIRTTHNYGAFKINIYTVENANDKSKVLSTENRKIISNSGLY